jgi:hypothetical protein
VGGSWAEEEHVRYLQADRRRFAWVMQQPEAEAAAQARYAYEASSDQYCGLIFHDQARHWAMLMIPTTSLTG